MADFRTFHPYIAGGATMISLQWARTFPYMPARAAGRFPVNVQIDPRELEGNDRLRWILATGTRGRCPRCGRGRMFQSWLKLAHGCEVCGLDYSYATPDDGPAFFALCFVTFPFIFLAMWVELAFEPPFWVHAVTSGPLLIASCVLGLRPLKGWLVASQYVNEAQEAGTERLFGGQDGGQDGGQGGAQDGGAGRDAGTQEAGVQEAGTGDGPGR
jgi:uncharacterized protein (DUF983 family)